MRVAEVWASMAGAAFQGGGGAAGLEAAVSIRVRIFSWSCAGLRAAACKPRVPVVPKGAFQAGLRA